ncbi:inactive serine/threonine-protein kinase TEX14 isoform X3 [Hemicordylus capensis]|uniref:inactive serine/threonine-protein kinase TEX14 isoform X3 n=1 Tax=Hemicordylus capensis TaxID=884348 RepID=UPI0023048B2C|nr:inactive serine/threonine-protein kinase TEX14 isoform X3 [Hemicordylus capensis]
MGTPWKLGWRAGAGWGDRRSAAQEAGAHPAAPALPAGTAQGRAQAGSGGATPLLQSKPGVAANGRVPRRLGKGIAAGREKMAHPALPIPCPVRLGWLKEDSPEAQLHQYVKQGSYLKVKKLLKKGVCADSVNSLGQTALFISALLGLEKLVDVLLNYGSDPNHRCYDGSSPVHAGAFSGNQAILSKLLDAGGDLRVHDKNGRTPQTWGLMAGKESSGQMLEFIQRCTSHMQATLQNYSSDLLRKVDSPRALVCSPSKFGGLTQGPADSPLGRFLKGGSSSSRNIYSFGFGKFSLSGSRQLGYLASLPIIADKEVVQADDEPSFSFPTGPYMVMTNLMWGGSRVTVKELSVKPHHHCSKLRLGDLLLAEQEYSSKLRHPHLLQLMAVCLSSDLEKTRLVFERVNFGTLYSILHERRSEFPILHVETIVHLLLQVNDALRFLHLRGFVHRTLSSYAILVVLAGEAKLTNLEYMIESKDGGEHSDLTRVPIPCQLFKWCAPEVVLERAATAKSDIYSFCAVMQEALTDTVPWNGLEGSAVRDLVTSGQCLEADARLPKPFYDIVKTGLEVRQKDRSMTLQDIRYILKNDLKDLIESRRNHPGDNVGAPKTEARPDINIYLPSVSAVQVQLPGEEAARVARSFTVSRCAVSSPKMEAVAALRHAEPCEGWETALEVQAGDSDGDSSLSSFEINEIYTCYPELCAELCAAEEEEEEQGAELGPAGAPRESPAAPGAWGAEGPPQPSGGSGEEGSSEAEVGYSVEELSPTAQALHSAGSGGPEARRSQPPLGLHFGKCVLDLKISQTLLQQAEGSLCRTQEQLESLGRPPLAGAPWEQYSPFPCGLEAPCSGASTLLWKAVGPPSRAYTPPPLRVLAHQPPQARGPPSRNQDAVCWSEAGPEAAPSPGDGAQPGYQHLYPGVSARRRRRTVQTLRDNTPSPTRDGLREADRISPRSASEIYEASLRSEERRMAQTEWTTEVKQMAKKAASGLLGLPAQYPPSEWTSESEAESAKEASGGCNNKEHLKSGWRKAEAGRPWAGRGLGDHKPTWASEEEESDLLEAALKRFVGAEKPSRSGPFPASEVQIECGVALHRSPAVSVVAEDLCGGQPEGLYCSPSSSLDVSEEFFTPDPDFFFCSPVPQEDLALESLSAEEEEEENLRITHDIGELEEGLEVTQEICGRKEFPVDAQKAQFSSTFCCLYSGGKPSLCSMEAKHFHGAAPGGDLFTPAARPGAVQGRRPEEVLPAEFREEGMSLPDIRDLSSISCEDSCKQTACKTPKSALSPADASTPVSPGSKLSSTVTKYKDFCVMTIDTTSWSSQEASPRGLSTFPTACEKGTGMEMPPGLQQPLAGLSEPRVFLEPTTQPLLPRSQTVSGSAFLAARQVGPEQLELEAHELVERTLQASRGDSSLWAQETSDPGEETQRAHSSLDHVLEGILDSRDLPEEEPGPASREPVRTHCRNVEMAGREEEEEESSAGEPEARARNAEGLS